MTKQELLKTVKPILFNTDMVRAILDGRKSETRRALKVRYKDDECGFRICRNIETGEQVIETTDSNEGGTGRYIHSPYRPGDILYVRETWCKGTLNNLPEQYYYKADNVTFHCKWHPSIHMPKEAARIFLKVTDVRVERLQDITISGMRGEGVIPKSVTGGQWQQLQDEYFKPVWNSTIPKKDRDKYGWDANPWVWVIEFERIEVEE